jgi:hypothetical protein
LKKRKSLNKDLVFDDYEVDDDGVGCAAHREMRK